MRCHLCKEDKLSKEFPFDPLTENCNHPLLHCLECATFSVREQKECSQCSSAVGEDNEIYLEYLETLNFLFRNQKVDNDDEKSTRALNHESYLQVMTLSGESTMLTYQSKRKILEVKKQVEEHLKIPVARQRLLYDNKELKVRNENKLLTLDDYAVPPNSSLHLIVILCAVPEELDRVVFDFCWGIPPDQRRDFLDVSVFLYSGRQCRGIINFRNPERSACPGVTHSGRAKIIKSRKRRYGQQQVNLALKSVPDEIDKLVFTLSAYSSSSISEFPYYRLQFYDVNFPDKQLCTDEMSDLEEYESVIMACLSKNNGIWEAVSLKTGASGCVGNYGPLSSAIAALLRRGF